MKLSAERGRPQWRRRFDDADGGYVSALATRADDDVIAAVEADRSGGGFRIVRLDAAHGSVVWRHDVMVPAPTSRDRFAGLALGAGGDVMVAAGIADRCSSGVNDDGLRGLAVSDLGIAIAARVGDPRGPRWLIARFPLVH